MVVSVERALLLVAASNVCAGRGMTVTKGCREALPGVGGELGGAGMRA